MHKIIKMIRRNEAVKALEAEKTKDKCEYAPPGAAYPGDGSIYIGGVVAYPEDCIAWIGGNVVNPDI